MTISLKIQEKMNKILNVQVQKANKIETIKGTLGEKHELAVLKKEALLKQISMNPVVQKERYSNASRQKLKAMEEKLIKKQTIASENKENILQVITAKLSEKMDKVYNAQSQKHDSVAVLQDKLSAKHALALDEKEIALKLRKCYV